MTIAYSTYWGAGPAVLRAAKADDEGNIYLAGGTVEKDWPIAPPSSR